WGLALAPDNFGPFSGALLVGNFGLGDGKINAYDPDTGEFLGHLTDANGNPLKFERLWALTFGNGVTGGSNVLFFTAGINGEQDGLFGSIRFDSSPSGFSAPGGAGEGLSGGSAAGEVGEGSSGGSAPGRPVGRPPRGAPS